jgi:serine protease DegS
MCAGNIDPEKRPDMAPRRPVHAINPPIWGLSPAPWVILWQFEVSIQGDTEAVRPELATMKQLLNFTVWPALAGMVFAVTLLVTPRLLDHIPALQPYLPQPAVQPVQSTPARISFNNAIRNAAPAVVSINSRQTVVRPESKLFYTPLGFQRARVGVPVEDNSLGSGVIISPDGYIVTSYHVIFSDEIPLENSSDISISLNDGREMKARLMEINEADDLALLKIDAENLPYMKPAETSNLMRGDIVLAIGNPRNIGQSVTQGIISALWRRGDSFVIQTDAAINPGNSGGALIDIDGNLIGINSIIVSESGGSEGISFAIPADKAISLLQEFTPSGYLGVEIEAVTLDRGLAEFNTDVQGFMVNDVFSNSPAEKAGIRIGDIITGVNDTKLRIQNSEDQAEAYRVISAISNFPPGELITLELFRDGETMKLPVILGVGEPKVFSVLEEQQVP